MNKPRFPSELESSYDIFVKTDEAYSDAKNARSDAEFRLKEEILKDINLCNYVMNISYAKLRRWMKNQY